MLDQVSRNFGFQENFTDLNAASASAAALLAQKKALKPKAQSTSAVPAPNIVSSFTASQDRLEADEKKDNQKEMNVTDMMRDTHLVDRYSKYLNKCLFITNDPFLKRKHQQYLHQ